MRLRNIYLNALTPPTKRGKLCTFFQINSVNLVFHCSCFCPKHNSLSERRPFLSFFIFPSLPLLLHLFFLIFRSFPLLLLHPFLFHLFFISLFSPFILLFLLFFPPFFFFFFSLFGQSTRRGYVLYKERRKSTNA